MADVLVIGFIVGFFLLAVLLVKACERIVGAEAELEPVRGEARTEQRAA
jgi:hypothetical protein